MTNPTLTVSIDRTDLSLPALVFSGTPAVGQLALSDFTEPVIEPQIRYATPSSYENDDDIIGFRLAESHIGWSFFTDAAASEQESRSLVASVRNALLRRSYEVTITVNGATPEVWTCKPGTVTPLGPRTWANLTDANPEFQVTIPCHPVRIYA